MEITQTATDGKWSTAACTNAKKFMCERPEGGMSTYIFLNNNNNVKLSMMLNYCYYYY